MQEYVEEKSVNLAVTSSKLTARTVANGLKAYLRHCQQKNKKGAMVDNRIKGKQTVKQLIGQNQGVSSLPVGETGLKDFERIAKKCGVDFAIVKDKTTEPVKYTVFFKARDADAIAQVLSEYTAKQMRKQTRNRPSILKILKQFKEMLNQMPKREHEKKKEQTR